MGGVSGLADFLLMQSLDPVGCNRMSVPVTLAPTTLKPQPGGDTCSSVARHVNVQGRRHRIWKDTYLSRPAERTDADLTRTPHLKPSPRIDHDGGCSALQQFGLVHGSDSQRWDPKQPKITHLGKRGSGEQALTS